MEFFFERACDDIRPPTGQPRVVLGGVDKVKKEMYETRMEEKNTHYFL